MYYQNPRLPKYGGREGEGNFRPMTFQEARALSYGNHIWFVGARGDARRVKVNGRPRTWVRSPDRIEIPVKYGMYEFAIFNERDIAEGKLLVPTDSEENPYRDSDTGKFLKGQRIRCNRCEMTMINEVPCHESGCPNQNCRFEDGEWVRYFDCRECGSPVREGEGPHCPDYESNSGFKTDAEILERYPEELLPRARRELQMVNRLLRDAKAAGYTITISDYEEEKGGTPEDLKDALFGLDEAHVILHKDGKRIGWVFLVFGNDGWDLISDYSANARVESLLKGCFALSDRLSSRMEENPRRFGRSWR